MLDGNDVPARASEGGTGAYHSVPAVPPRSWFDLRWLLIKLRVRQDWT